MSDSISGLREQILANATIAFPKITRWKSQSSAPPFFGVIVTTRPNDLFFMAQLTYENAGGKAETVAHSGLEASVSAALLGLLQVLGVVARSQVGAAQNLVEVFGAGKGGINENLVGEA